MLFRSEERPSESPLVECVWCARSERTGVFTSLATSHRMLVVTRHNGTMTLTVRGPDTRATPLYCSVQAEWIGIVLKLGVFMPHLPDDNLVDRAIDLPPATKATFWLRGAAWQFPTYENADTFVARLVREGLLVRDPVVDAALRDQSPALSPRSLQRRFVRATGLPQGVVRQIERARHAAALLQAGMPIADTAARVGYADQPHLTRSLRRFIGQTPARLARPDNPEQTSLLFKTERLPFYTMGDEPGGSRPTEQPG
jgi:AraC-like DNA-binding protein